MIEARPDWVLSRQRAWGVPLTCFVKRQPDGTAEILRDPAVNARIKDAFEHEGADAWFEDDAKARFLANDHPHDDWEKVTDILDVWFDSGSTHAFVAARPPRRHLAGDRLPRGHRPAPRLVPLLDAAGLRHPRPRALRRGDHPRLHPRRERHEDVEVARQHHRPAGRDQAVRRRHPAPLGGADRLRRRPAHRPGDPQGHRRQLPPPAQHPALPPRRPRRLRRGRARRARGDARARALGAAPPGRARPRRCATATPPSTSRASSRRSSSSRPSTSRPSTSTSARTRSTATPPADPRRRAARTVLDALFHRLVTWLAPMLPFTMEEVWLARFPGEESSVHLVDFPATPVDWHDAAPRREVGGDPPRPPRRHRRARGRAPRQAHRRQPRGRARRSTSPTPPCAPRSPRSTSPTSASPPASPSTAGAAPGRTPSPSTTSPASPWSRRWPRAAKCARCWKILPDVGTHAHPRRLRALRRGAPLTVRAARPPDGRPHGRREPVGGESFQRPLVLTPDSVSARTVAGSLAARVPPGGVARGVHLEPV